ncbi:hypothetical protein V496_09854 [Pseudogymnoascus sp. VKM F-4515 (FW-2607)]|nr:hypothetical protein V496_09854 [Pseudogymnoascus sp. VKM F-4515 (FW-2607)]
MESPHGSVSDEPLSTPPNSNGFGGCSCASHRTFHHRDCMGRRWTGPDDDRYLSPYDGRLKKLVVQTVGEWHNGPASATWERTTIRNTTPLMLRIVCWAMSSISMSPYQKEERGQIDEESSPSLNPHRTSETDEESQLSGDSWGPVCVKWAPACVALFFLLFIPTDLNGEVRNNGFYEKFRYRYWGYSKIPRNPQESAIKIGSAPKENQEINPISERPLRPRYLCFLEEVRGVRVENVERWLSQRGNEYDMRYIFISYTSEQFSPENEEDMEALHHIAERAARADGVPAYWIGCSCMPDDDQLTEDVHRISDVVRGAHSLVIIVGPPSGDGAKQRTTMLRQLGNRMWTFPEVLLSPGDHQITIYTRGQDLNNPSRVAKRNFAALAWDDAAISRQLVDHYESYILLTPLELVTLALRCLQGRETTQYFAGDMAYALMGLLRRRPKVDEHDTAFQAFARLSLANDSNKLLERLICILPKDTSQQWYTIDDAWDVNLWDIDPMCQVAGVGEGDTVILSGAFAAPIRWKSFAPVALLTRNTAKRWVARICLRGVPAWFIFGVMLTKLGDSSPKIIFLLGIGCALLGLALATTLASPYMLRAIYMGKSWGTQPWFFGFEGHLDIGTIEANIFGVNLGRLTWSPFSSELSRHYEADYKECIGIDPTEDPDIRDQVEKASGGEYGKPKIFTLVDTYTMTVTLFRAVRPPVAVLLCGSEGGMQRAVMCSYDWRTQTLYRETVLRMKTLVLEKMSRVDSVRVGLQRPSADTLMPELHSLTCPERGAQSV